MDSRNLGKELELLGAIVDRAMQQLDNELLHAKTNGGYRVEAYAREISEEKAKKHYRKDYREDER